MNRTHPSNPITRQFSRRRLLQGAAAFGVASAASAFTPEIVRGGNELLVPPRTLDLSGATVLATFDAGSGPQQLGVRNVPGVEPGGPQSICARSDGTIAILDTLNRRIAIVRGSSIASRIPLPQAVFPLDIQESGSQLVVLDPAGEQLLEVNEVGFVSKRPLPTGRRAGASRLGQARQAGAVSLVVEDGFATNVDLTTGEQGPGAQGHFAGGAYGPLSVQYPASMPESRRSAVVNTTTASFVVDSSHPLGSVLPLGTDRRGFLYLLVTELPNSTIGGLDVDLQVRRYRGDGAFVAMARVPVRGRWSHPRTAVSITTSGEAIALVTEPTRTSIVQLAWVSSLVPLRPFTALFQATAGIANAAQTIPNSRATASSIADGYQNYWWQATSAMLGHTCGGATDLPSYITGIGWYKEIPYCWGGYDTTSSYVSNINSPNNYHLGDVNGGSGGWKGCTAGADCSGYISRAWGTSHRTTETLLDYVTNSPGQSQSEGGTLYLMDMWRLPYTHVRLHYSYPQGGGGDYMYEESISWGERAWFAYRPWSEYPGYLWCLGKFAS